MKIKVRVINWWKWNWHEDWSITAFCSEAYGGDGIFCAFVIILNFEFRIEIKARAVNHGGDEGGRT